MEYGRAHRAESFACLKDPFLTVRQIIGRLYDQISVGDMGRVVHGKSDGYDYVHDNDGVESQVPVVDQGDEEVVNEDDG